MNLRADLASALRRLASTIEAKPPEPRPTRADLTQVWIAIDDLRERIPPAHASGSE